MNTKDEALNLKDLCAAVGVAARTVHYYIQQGLIPPAGSHGPAAKYEKRHLDRLRLVKMLQRQHLPLAEIRDRLRQLSDDEVARSLEESVGAQSSRAPESALDYVRGVLGRESTASGGQRDPAADMFNLLRAAAGTIRPPIGWDRSQWDRIALTPDVEIHVRRPLTREGNRKLERLLEEARRIWKEEP